MRCAADLLFRTLMVCWNVCLFTMCSKLNDASFVLIWQRIYGISVVMPCWLWMICCEHSHGNGFRKYFRHFDGCNIRLSIQNTQVRVFGACSIMRNSCKMYWGYWRLISHVTVDTTFHVFLNKGILLSFATLALRCLVRGSDPSQGVWYLTILFGIWYRDYWAKNLTHVTMNFGMHVWSTIYV